jgi:TonB family protein
MSSECTSNSGHTRPARKAIRPSLHHLLLCVMLISSGTSVLGQRANPQPDSNGIYAGWNGVAVASIVHAVPAELPQDAKLTGIKHVCALLVIVGADGVLKNAALANKSASPFDEAAIKAVSQSQFAPGSFKGKPVATRLMIWVPFFGDGRPAIPFRMEPSSKKPDTSQKVIPPLPTFTPEAEFSDEARRSHSGGDAAFQILVDEEGSMKAITQISAAGKGLDQNAYAAVRKYRFKPANLDGIPVPFLLTLEVNFRM